MDGSPFPRGRRPSAAREYAAAVRLAEQAGVRAVVLVEGESDRAAVETVARRTGRDLPAGGVHVVPIGGATSISRFVELFGPRGANLHLAGLCDAAEEHHFRHGLERAGLGPARTRPELERHGFFVCAADLEDELIRALGAPVVEAVVDQAGELGLLRTFQRQPAQRDRIHEHQLHRFMGTRSGRKIEYARLLAERLDLRRVPRPIEQVLRHVAG
jgi:hypothetical protein